MRILIAFLLVSLAGCAGAQDPVEFQETEPQVEPNPDPIAPAPVIPDGNTPPSAALSALEVHGTAPFTSNVTVAAEDVDGDALQWSLDLDGDGTADAEGDEFPTSVPVSYDAGEHTVSLTVRDGFYTTITFLTFTVDEAQ